MHSLYASVWNETLKIAYKKKTLFFMIMTLIIPAGAALLLANVQGNLGISAVSSSDFPIVMLNLFTAIFLPLFVFMGAADHFSGEISDRTLKVILTRPISRFKVFAAKQISLAMYIAAYLLIALIASVVSAFFLSGVMSGFAVLDWLIAYGTAFVPLAVLSITAVLLAQFFTSSSGALTISILLYIAAKVGAFFFPQALTYSPTSYMDWHMLWLGRPMPSGELWSICMFLLACSILFFTAGFYLFDKKEL
ncbi:hypothetical protein SD71_03750 [Cohnella kolymensis]|uniref:ABC transporter permease n=1 Tax=Cohnella kolymensis TaxID=1590652 RepID=A0ABR5A7Q9_9BACL|nr:ABC transporter permease [Cohnella kolymensis]KIL37091.1 hypothetical protein SD71_03750 [Cohnella kolymensis]